MTRLPIFLAAIAASAMAVSAAVDAAEPTDFTFQLKDEGGADRIRADFRRAGTDHDQWNSTFRASDLTGLDRATLTAQRQAPLQFALVRDAGRLDCSGTGGNGAATGRCRFTADQAFLDYLRASGVASVSGEDAYAMTAIGVRRDLVEAIGRANYPAPSANDLVALAALGVDRGYIEQMASAGYRPDRINTLIEFKALGVTPEYVAGFQRLGIGRPAASELVQFKALGIDSAYVDSLRGVGYGGLPSSKLVEFKALGVDAAYIDSLRRAGYTDLRPDTLVEFRALGVTADYIADVERAGYGKVEPRKLIEMRALGIGLGTKKR